MRKDDFDWTPEAVATLRRMDSDGATMSEIAVAIGVSRSAVVGKRKRLGMTRPVIVVKPKPVVKPPSRPRTDNGGGIMKTILSRGVKGSIPLPLAPPEGEDSTGVTLMDLRDGLCRWPLSSPADEQLFCGREADGVYCRRHRDRAYIERKLRR